MGVKYLRKKSRNIPLGIIYRIFKLIPVSSELKIKLSLNLAWIFERLSNELSFKCILPNKHPVKTFSTDFLLSNIRTNDVVLDLGCAVGEISFIIAQKAKEVVGIDYNEKSINIAKQTYSTNNLSFICDEASKFLESNKKGFDILILSHILEHLDNPKEFLLSFKNYFDYIYLEVPDFDRTYLNYYRKELGLYNIYSDNDHVSEFDRNEIKNILTDCHIDIINEEYRYGVQKFWCHVNKQR